MKTSIISAVLIAILCIVLSDSASAHGRRYYRHHHGCYTPRSRAYCAPAPRYYQPRPVQVYYAPATRYCPPPPPPACRQRYAYRGRYSRYSNRCR